jgi:DNA-binding response OmpR family regulator
MRLNADTPAIVLIETDDVTLELYQRELVKSFTVFAFTEIEKAREAITQQNIQAVVIEPEINGGEGWEFIRNLRADSTLPVIVCSTRDESNSELIVQVSEYLTKPVSPRTLRAKTLEVIRQSEQQRIAP